MWNGMLRVKISAVVWSINKQGNVGLFPFMGILFKPIMPYVVDSSLPCLVTGNEATFGPCCIEKTSRQDRRGAYITKNNAVAFWPFDLLVRDLMLSETF